MAGVKQVKEVQCEVKQGRTEGKEGEEKIRQEGGVRNRRPEASD